jgi:hypothetical protein
MENTKIGDVSKCPRNYFKFCYCTEMYIITNDDDNDDGDDLVTSTVPDLPPVPDHDLVVENLSNRFAKLNA